VTDVDFLLDTAVLVEWLRGRSAAKNWLAGQGSQRPGIPYIVRLELLQGARDKREIRAISNALAPFLAIAPESVDADVAEAFFLKHALSDGVGILDCLIGAVALRLQTPIYSFNTKHLGVFENVDVRVPYPLTS